VRELSETSQGIRGATVGPSKGRMKNDEKRQVSRGRRGSNETKLVLVGVASGKTRNSLSPIGTARGSQVICVMDMS